MTDEIPSKPTFLLMPPRILGVLLVAAALVHFVAGLRGPYFKVVPVGIGLIAFGLAANGWASRLFDTAKTPICPGSTPTKLVDRGPFRWSRNPMYLRLIVLLLGIALLVGSWPFWVLPPLYALILRFLFIPHEEEMMWLKFGNAYDRYCSCVGRWLRRRCRRESAM